MLYIEAPEVGVFEQPLRQGRVHNELVQRKAVEDR